MTQQLPCKNCGRVGPHCPACGSKSRYGLANERFIDPTTGRMISVYRCRRCSEKYHDLTECTAPPTEMTRAEKNTFAKQAMAEQFLAERGVSDADSREEKLRKLFARP